MTASRAKDTDFSHFHHIVRWFYRIVFGFLIFGIVASVLEGFIEEWFASGQLAFPELEHLYILQLLVHYPLIVGPPIFVLIALGFFGLIIDLRFTKMKRAQEQEHVERVAQIAGTTAAGKVIEEKSSAIVETAVKKGIEVTAFIQTAVKKGIEEALKERDNAPDDSKTSFWEPPMYNAVLPLPPAVCGLVGRKEDQNWLEACILQGKIVGVSGLGGVGKTTLVADTTNKVAPQCQGGVVVVLANEVTNSMIILHQLVEKFVPNQHELLSRTDTKLNMLSEALSHILTMRHEKGHRVLVVIDGIEPGLVKDEGLEGLCNIFRSAKVSVVMTARERLPVRLVHECRELEVFSDEAAVNLLTRLLEGFLQHPLSDAERLNAAAICEIAGNHAQALVLIAAYLEYHPQTSLTAYLLRLKDSPKIVLDLTNRLQPIDASRGIRLTFASSYSQLEEPAQQLFVALGALTGQGCSCLAIGALGVALNQPEDETQVSLGALIRSKLVLIYSTDPSGTVERIHLHPLVQEFARELLRSLPEMLEDRLDEALADHFAEWVQNRIADALSRDDANLIAALKWSMTHLPRADFMLAKLAYGLRWYWQSQFQLEQAFKWLQAGCDAMERLGTDWDKQRGELMFAMGSQYQWIGMVTEAERCYQKSLTIFGKIGSKVGQGEALAGLAALSQQKGEMEKARNLYERSLRNFRRAGDRRNEADAMYRLGFLALRIGNIDAALNYYDESLSIRLILGDDQWGEGIIQYSLGNVFQQIGDIDKAQHQYENSLKICQQIYNRRGKSIVLKALGDLALQTSGPTEAEKYLSQSHNISREIFDPQSEAIELYSMGFLLRQTGKIYDAYEYYNKSLEIREKIKDERGRGFTLKGLGDLARRMGEMPTAKRQLEEALAISRRIKDRRNEGAALKALGDWAWQSSDLDTARSYYEESLPIRIDCRDLRGEAITIKALGDLALQEGDKATAQKNLNQILTLFREMKDQRGEGIAFHSLAILALEEGDSATSLRYLNQSLSLIQSVHDRQSESAVLYTLALWNEIQGNLSQAEHLYRECLQIAIEIKVMYNLALFQEALGDFLIRRYGQKSKYEGDQLLIQAAEKYNRIGRYDDARHTEERRGERYKFRDKDRIVRALIYDFDEGPNGQTFAVPTERRN